MVAGFALVMLLAHLAENGVNWFCMSCGWITKMPLLDFLEEGGFLAGHAAGRMRSLCCPVSVCRYSCALPRLASCAL